MAHYLERQAKEKEELINTINVLQAEKEILNDKITDLEERLIKIEPKEATP